MTTQPTPTGRLLYIVACAAPPAREIGDLIDLVEKDGWTTAVIPTPVAATWMDTEALAERTGHPLRSQQRHIDEPPTLPPADAVVAAPVTFNTINKWAAGIADTFALGLLHEALGLGLPIVACPHAKPALTSHPAFARSVELLSTHGVRFTEVNALGITPGQPSNWQAVVTALREVTS